MSRWPLKAEEHSPNVTLEYLHLKLKGHRDHSLYIQLTISSNWLSLLSHIVVLTVKPVPCVSLFFWTCWLFLTVRIFSSAQSEGLRMLQMNWFIQVIWCKRFYLLWEATLNVGVLVSYTFGQSVTPLNHSWCSAQSFIQKGCVKNDKKNCAN